MTVERARMLEVARPASLAAAAVALVSPGLWLGAPLDVAAFMLVAARMRQGEMPYRDVWDHKPPGAYVVNWLGQSVLPWLDPWLVSWLISAVVSVAAAVVLYFILVRRFSPPVAWWWGLVGVVGVACYPVALGGGLTESLALLPLLGAWWLAVARAPSWRALGSIGVLLAVACLLSLQAAAPAAVVAVAAVLSGRGWRVALGGGSVVAGAAALPLLLTGVWLMAGGAVGDAVDQVIVYNAAYRASASSPAELWLIVGLMLGGLLVPATVGALRLRPRAADRLDWSALAWVLAEAAYVVYQGRIYLHYLILVIPPLVLLAAAGLEGFTAGVRSPTRERRFRALAFAGWCATAMLASAMVTLQVGMVTLDRAASDKAPADQVARWVRAETCASAKLFVWGDNAYLYLGSERDPYDRYVYQFPMVTRDYWSAERTGETLARWQASPPDVILEGPSVVPLFRPAVEPRDSRDFDTLKPLREFVAAHYRQAATFGDEEFFWDVYLYQSGGC